ELVPVAQLGHGYEFVAFDERHQRFLMQPMPNTYWANAMPQRLGWLPSANFPASQYRSPWLFDTVAGRWLRQPTGALAPNFQTGSRATVVHGFGDGRFLYFDAHPANQHRVWWFDAATLSWQDEATASAGPAISGHGVSCLDRARGRLWFYGVDAATQKARLWCYDAHNRRWTDPQAVGTPQHTVIYTTSDRGMTYDAERDLVLLKVGQGGTTPSEFHAYDVALGVWRPPVSPPAALGVNWNWRHINACYAAGYDVHVLHVAPGNSGTGRIVLYRAP
ncbi:MAG: hypothetical protein KAI24_05490, partial [Planctomycetes bacterium]|nr:hypothetical protein [Planctomycetota bacterium]